MKNIDIREATVKDSFLITQFMDKYWGGEPLVIRGQNYYPSKLESLIAFSGEQVMGIMSYDIQGEDCEIVVFEVLEKFSGLGTQMLESLKELMRPKQVKRLFLMTTNDNLDALRFYQRRGFRICGIHMDSMKESRSLKPSIPLTGDYNIPLRDEIDLEYIL